MRYVLSRLALLAASTAVALLVAEVGLRIAAPQIFAVHPPGMYQLDDAVGYTLTPGRQFTFAQPEFEITVTTNAAGLRGPELVDGAGDVRVLVLGDSQAWGFGVADDETLAVQLQTLLQSRYPARPISVLNGGVPGYGSADQLAFLRARIDALQPDIVVVQFLSVNDLQENLAPAATWATLEDGMLAHRNPGGGSAEAPTWERWQRALKRHSHLARLALDTVGYWGTRSGLLGDVDALWGEDFTPETAQLGVETLVDIVAVAAEHGAPTLLLYTTGQAHVLRDPYVAPRSAGVVAAAAAAAGAPWVDVSAALQPRADVKDLYFHQNGHWTAVGHQAVAEIVADQLVRLGWIDSIVVEGG